MASSYLEWRSVLWDDRPVKPLRVSRGAGLKEWRSPGEAATEAQIKPRFNELLRFQDAIAGHDNRPWAATPGKSSITEGWDSVLITPTEYHTSHA